jgi:hypothetical protein
MTTLRYIHVLVIPFHPNAQYSSPAHSHCVGDEACPNVSRSGVLGGLQVGDATESVAMVAYPVMALGSPVMVQVICPLILTCTTSYLPLRVRGLTPLVFTYLEMLWRRSLFYASTPSHHRQG